MKKALLLMGMVSLLAVSCGEKKVEEKTEPTTTEATAQEQTGMPAESTEATAGKNVITENEGKNPRDFKLFEDATITDRLKKIAGDKYEELVKNFNVETPVVSEDGIYKVTGCKKDACPEFQTTILFDSKNDNFNVIIDENGKVTEFAEKGKINYTESLKSK